MCFVKLSEIVRVFHLVKKVWSEKLSENKYNTFYYFDLSYYLFTKRVLNKWVFS